MNSIKSLFGTPWARLRRRQTRMIWDTKAGRHVNGKFSMAVLQANNPIEDKSQIESSSLILEDRGPIETFVGVYDGHGGTDTSEYIKEHLFRHLNSKVLKLDSCSPGYATEVEHTMSVDVLRMAFQATEEGFLSVVTEQWPGKPQIAAVGSCCLVGVISKGTLYVANLGDSRAVLGRLERATGKVIAVQLSEDHNAANESVRQELHSLHPDDPQIVFIKNGCWRVKGIIQISRSIGDAFLKKTEFNRAPLPERLRLDKPFNRPILSSEPSILVQALQLEDKFLIFASDGLWDALDNQEAVDIVRDKPNRRSARRLVKAAIKALAKRRGLKYSAFKNLERNARRDFHDDITVIVVFLDFNLISGATNKVSCRSLIKGCLPLPSSSSA